MTARPGIALVLVLLVLLLIELMAAGMIALAGQARLVAAGEARLARADTRAHAGTRVVLLGWDSARYDTLPPLIQAGDAAASGAAGDMSWTTTVERLSSGIFVIRGFAKVGAGAAFSRARVVAVARTLDRAGALAELNAAAASGGPAILAGAARVSASEFLPTGWSGGECPVPDEAVGPASALLTARPPTVGWSATVDGELRTDTTAFPDDSAALGGVRWSQLADIADRIESGTVTPRPPASEDGRCDGSSAANWGDPDRPAGPCADWRPLIFAPGDLRVAGGVGQGILVVAGRLTLSGGFRFAGAIVAGGGLDASEDVRVFGAVRSTGGPLLVDGADILFSRCAVAAALYAAPGARRRIVKDRTFLPPF